MEHALQDSEDIRYMVGALEALGIQLVGDWATGHMTVHGCGGRFPVEGADLFLGNAGTAMRCDPTPLLPRPAVRELPLSFGPSSQYADLGLDLESGHYR